jgi:hypothetical protein
MFQFVTANDKDEVTHIRFGGFGSGSETWIKGQKMKPQFIKSLKDLLKQQENNDVKPEKKVEENLEDMFD